MHPKNKSHLCSKLFNFYFLVFTLIKTGMIFRMTTLYNEF
jgi:hypothetical protein